MKARIENAINSLQEFKSEFRLVCSDTWGEALGAWFECAGQMNKRGMVIPELWQYRPPMFGDGTEEDSYWFELFENSTDDMLREIGAFLFRYCQYLEFKGVNY